jgi:tetratricopeptide (TPR) repeat protein/TolB-like protein
MLVAGSPHRSDRVVVTDFGLARPIAKVDRSLSTMDTLAAAGTPAYIAPEQLEGHRATPASDIYALGVVIYEMLTGTYPFSGPSPFSLAAQRLTRPPLPPSTYVPDLDKQWEHTVLRCLERDPALRFSSAADVCGALGEAELACPASRLAAAASMTTQALSGAASWMRQRRSLAAASLLAMILVTVGVTISYRATVARSAARAIDKTNTKGSSAIATIRSLAILPFSVRLSETGNHVFSERLREELTIALSRAPELRVLPWNTASYFNRKQVEPLTAGRRLNVRAVVEGEIEAERPDGAFTVHLLDVDSGRSVWSNTYRTVGQVDRILATQIASDIARILDVPISVTSSPDNAKRYTEDVETYVLYKEGRQYWSARNRDGLEKAVARFQQVVKKDPEYALGYAGLADCYYLLGSYNLIPPRRAFPLARTMAARALEIDGTLAEAYTSLAIVKAEYDWDRKGAEAAYKRAIQLNPAYATAHEWYAEFLSASGRFSEAIGESQQAEELDPDSQLIRSARAIVFFFARQYDAAIAQSRKAIDVDPDYPLTYFFLGHSYEQKAMYPEAIDAYREGVRRSGGLGKAYLAHAYAIAGRHDEAMGIVRDLTSTSRTDYVSPYEMALVATGMGDERQAIRWLKQAYVERSSLLLFLNVDPRYDALRMNPEFQALVARVG